MSEKEEKKGDASCTDAEKIVEVKKEVDGPPSPKRVKVGDRNDFKKVTRDSLLSKFLEQDGYVDYLEEKLKQCSNNGELTSLRESEEKLKLQQQESTRRENVLVMRLATKEQEMQELLTQIHDLKQSQNPAGAQLRSTLLDPAVNIVFQRMKSELDETKEKLEQAQNDLSAWKFTPDSVTGKKLMAKCRMLIQENQELGRQLSQGRVAQLEAELALQKKYSDELKNSQDELNEFVIQLDEEVEGMQSTILALQKQLKGVRSELVEEKQNGDKQVEQIRVLEQNLDQARTQPPSPVEGEKRVSEPMKYEPDTNDAEDMEEDIERRAESTGYPTRGTESPGKGTESPGRGIESPGRGTESPGSESSGSESPLRQCDPEFRTEDENHRKPDVNTEPQEPSTYIKKPPTGTPPCPTTFSISQILGQSKNISASPVEVTPMQSSPGGDAVVTKIAYLGAYNDPSAEAMRTTDGTTVVNGNVTTPEDDTQTPMVT